MSSTLAPTLRSLFGDNFAADPSGTANSGKWTVATGAAEYIPNTLGSAEPGTELQPDLPSVAGGALDLTLQTYNPTSQPPGTSYSGSDVISTESFEPTPGVGIGITFVARLDTTVPGMALGMFAYAPTGADTHNEIDFEARTDFAGGQSSEIQTNIYDNAPDNSAGDASLEAAPSLTAYQTYTIEWFGNRVMWFVDGNLVRTDTANVPQGEMPVDLDLWGYDGTFASLPPVSSGGADSTYSAEVQSVTVAEIACFAPGTRIATQTGERAVETLAAGQQVLTASGAARPIVWLGHRRVDCRRHPVPEMVWPVRVRRDALGNGRPRRDLWLSPDHAVFVDGVLIPIRCLVSGTTIAQERRDEVTYWHVELDRHDILLAEGLPAESFLDVGNRGAFDNAAGPVMLHPDFARRAWAADACAELILGGPKLILARRRVAVQASLLGCSAPDVGDSFRDDGIRRSRGGNYSGRAT
jgi:beta-glucanase (GH16 family)